MKIVSMSTNLKVLSSAICINNQHIYGSHSEYDHKTVCNIWAYMCQSLRNISGNHNYVADKAVVIAKKVALSRTVFILSWYGLVPV